MAVPLSISTTISGLGVSLAWTASTTNTMGHLLSEPGPGVTLHVADAPASWSILYTGGKLFNATGSSFVFANEPTDWSVLSGTVNFTVYWTDASSKQQYAYTVPMTATGTYPNRTWTATNASYGGASVTPTNGDGSTSPTAMFNVILGPETADAAVVIPGEASSVALAQMFVGSSRVGLIVLEDAANNTVPFLVGPYSGTVWTGPANTDPIYALSGPSAVAHTGSTKAVFSTADTSSAQPIYVGYYTA